MGNKKYNRPKGEKSSPTFPSKPRRVTTGDMLRRTGSVLRKGSGFPAGSREALVDEEVHGQWASITELEKLLWLMEESFRRFSIASDQLKDTTQLLLQAEERILFPPSSPALRTDSDGSLTPSPVVSPGRSVTSSPRIAAEEKSERTRASPREGRPTLRPKRARQPSFSSRALSTQLRSRLDTSTQRRSIMLSNSCSASLAEAVAAEQEKYEQEQQQLNKSPLSAKSEGKSRGANVPPLMTSQSTGALPSGEDHEAHGVVMTDEVKQWHQSIDELVRQHDDLRAKTEFLLIESVCTEMRQYLNRVNEARGNYEKARDELLEAKNKLGRERMKLMSGPDGGEWDIQRLYECEYFKSLQQNVYEAAVIEIIELLTGERRNVQLSQGILKFLEVMKRFYLRCTMICKGILQRLEPLRAWTHPRHVAAQERLSLLPETTAAQQRLDLRDAWGLLARIISNPRGRLLDALLATFQKQCGEATRQGLMESLVYLYVAVEEPFPPSLSPFVHLAQSCLSEEEFVTSPHSKKLLQFLHLHFASLGDTLKKQLPQSEFLLFCAALGSAATEENLHIPAYS